MSWIQDLISPQTRKWEDFYRSRWQYDKVIRSTHGVNCTGGCSWNIHVKEGIVVWETQAVDYPVFDKNLPPYEPRGCQRGISASWYLYSPIRVKYPLMRGALLDLFVAEKRKASDSVSAWKNIQEDPEKRKKYQTARGKGGLRRVSWEDALEMIAASNIYTVQKYGPDRLAGFSPIPAMSMLSYAAGSRFLQLMGGLNLSFYDWYCDLPPSFPEMWGEQTDVAESADWYNAKFVAVMGANLAMTRTPDVHFFAESRHNGTKTVVFSPDFNMVAKYADTWIPVHAGQDGAFWMAVTHVILKEAHHEKQIPYFLDYVAKFTDSPFLVELEKCGDGYTPGKLLRANRVEKFKAAENGDWKFLNIDKESGRLVCPRGSVGHRWDSKHGNWSTLPIDGEDNTDYTPLLTLLENKDDVYQVECVEYGMDNKRWRGVPVKLIDTIDGKVPVTTVYDLIMAQYGVGRGLSGDYPKDYTDENAAYTPAWQELFTGIGSDTLLQFAAEWIRTAGATKGKCMIIIGAGINHWYHGNLTYRAGQLALALTGCIGKNGGGINHYVGQEKLAPVDSWAAIMSGKDWQGPTRLQQAPIWHYINSDQWRYDGNHSDYNTVPKNELSEKHTADMIVKAVRNGWMPFYPQYDKNNLEIAKDAIAAGAKDDKEIVNYVVEQLRSKKLTHSVVNPDAEINFPRVWYIWRGNALMSSAKGHEFFLKHYLGTHNNSIADEVAKDLVTDIEWKENAPEGKFDLIVDINFRMDTSALYSDIVLPTASWYEKNDLNSTDMHSFIHPLSAAVKPSWEAKPDWDIFKEIARVTSELAEVHMPRPVKDIVNLPIAHDSVGEISQSTIQDWSLGECEMIPGKTMHNIVVQERDYTKIYKKFIALGPNVRNGLGAHGSSFNCTDYYEDMLEDKAHLQEVDGVMYPSLKDDEEAANAILHLSSLTNGVLANRAYENAEKRTGLSLTDLSEGNKNVKLNFDDLKSQPRRYINSPIWSGTMGEDKAYAGFTYNVEKSVPWRTLTGRQHFYLDHEMYIKFGEHLPTYKPSPLPGILGDLKNSESTGDSITLNVLTPHGKWGIHSTYTDNIRMLTLSRGMYPCWISEFDADRLDIKDNDWVEVFNDYGVYSTRAVVSARIPKGICLIYHSPERTYTTPKSEVRGGKRSGGHNSLTRVRLKPNLMAGGYGQFTYHFNYWGPVGVNRDTFVKIQKMKKVEF
ncbi:MAG: nitrate reductase subunit alpha [Bacteroidales bacterium]|nr:nitrate reductase subunit alpha [Bacteroidales bacterium]